MHGIQVHESPSLKSSCSLSKHSLGLEAPSERSVPLKTFCAEPELVKDKHKKKNQSVENVLITMNGFLQDFQTNFYT
jgi:hypothetical protein